MTGGRRRSLRNVAMELAIKDRGTLGNRDCQKRTGSGVLSEEPQYFSRIRHVFQNLRTNKQVERTDICNLIQTVQNLESPMRCSHIAFSARLVTKRLDVPPASIPVSTPYPQPKSSRRNGRAEEIECLSTVCTKAPPSSSNARRYSRFPLLSSNDQLHPRTLA